MGKLCEVLSGGPLRFAIAVNRTLPLLAFGSGCPVLRRFCRINNWVLIVNLLYDNEAVHLVSGPLVLVTLFNNRKFLHLHGGLSIVILVHSGQLLLNCEATLPTRLGLGHGKRLTLCAS